ncbi:MAG: outer membrane lipoprotein-sorting protein, partial [Natronospirillum sp.]
LALVRSEADAGQKILMLDEQFYLFMPNSRRHIRITPMQKLLGEASAGDISSLRWSEDYQVVTQTNHGDQINLHLAAARDGLSYPTMDLVVAADTHEPVSAVFYLVSGRVAKEAHFQMADEDGYRRLTGMVLQDRIQTSQRTEIEYLSVEPWDIPASWFNPAFLVRNNL